MSNRVEHQKLNQTTAELSFGWVFGVQLGLRQTEALITTEDIIIILTTGKQWIHWYNTVDDMNQRGMNRPSADAGTD